MNNDLRNRFTELWRRYFNNAELPLAFFYTDQPQDTQPEPPFAGHRCMIGQLIKARNGRTLCFDARSVACRGGIRYLGFTDKLFPGFNEYISHNTAGEGERYRRTPEQVAAYIDALPVLPLKRYLVFKRWDKLAVQETPDGVLFFATPDILSGLFTLAYYDSQRPDAVIAPFGAGCMTTIYQTYREQTEGTQRCTIGMFDPSARKCLKADLISFGVPFGKFERMAAQMEESFLSTHSWEIIQRRIR